MQLLRERMIPRRLLGLVPLYPSAAPLVVTGENKSDRLATAALAKKPIFMAVCGSTCYSNDGSSKLVVKRLRCLWSLRRHALLVRPPMGR
jgi:hypothetical protein